MDYAGARSWLEGLGEFHMEFGLDRVRAVLERLGNPERCAPSVHVAGTNGKGATCAYLSSILRHARRRVGLYTSPHLSRPNERIALSGRPIDDEGFAAALTAVREAVEVSGTPLTYFEAMTAAAFVAFREAKVDVMVVETGLGGRLDATNVLAPAVTVITQIALDHTRLLGGTIEAIAGEKAGIVKPGVPVILTAQDPAAIRVVAARAAELGARVIRVEDGGPTGWTTHSGEPEPRELRVDGRTVHDGAIRGLGYAAPRLRHSIAGAVAAARALGEPLADSRLLDESIRDTRWPGRAEFRRLTTKVFGVFDGGHNPAAAAALAASRPFEVMRTRGNEPRVLVFGAMTDKDRPEILRALAAAEPSHVVCTNAGTARSATARSLAEDAREVFGDRTPVEAIELIPPALERAMEIAASREYGVLLVTGSLYLVGRARELLAGGPPHAIG